MPKKKASKKENVVYSPAEVLAIVAKDTVKLRYSSGKTIVRDYNSNRLDFGMEIETPIHELERAKTALCDYVEQTLDNYIELGTSIVEHKKEKTVPVNNPPADEAKPEPSLAEVLDAELNDLEDVNPKTPTAEEEIPDEF